MKLICLALVSTVCLGSSGVGRALNPYYWLSYSPLKFSVGPYVLSEDTSSGERWGIFKKRLILVLKKA